MGVSERLCHIKWWNHINDDSLHNKPTNCCYLDSMRQQFLLHYSPLIWYRSHSFVWGGSHSLTPTSHPGWFARDLVILNRVGWVLLQFILCGSCQTQSNNYCGRLFLAFRHSKWLSYSTFCQQSGKVIWGVSALTILIFIWIP